MDRSVVLSVLGLLLIILALVNTTSFDDFSRRWWVDPTLSLMNSGKESIRSIISPPETKVIDYEGKSIIILENLSRSQENALLTESKFRNALASGDRLLLYTSESGLNAILASYYFNDVEVKMLSTDEEITKTLKSQYSPGIVNLSHIDVSDPTNARVKRVELEAYWTPILVPYYVNDENFSIMEGSTEFKKVMEESRKMNKKSLLLWHPSKSDRSVIIPVKFSNDELKLLTKNSAVKTALDAMDVKAGETLNLEETREFQNADIARLPYEPNTRIYASFNIRGELGFLSQDILVYLAIFVVALVIFYVLYAMLIA